MSNITDYIEKVAKVTKEGGICHTQEYANKLKEKIKYIRAKKFWDEPLWLNNLEEKLLGISLSNPKIVSYNTSEVTHKVSDFLNKKLKNSGCFGVDILEIRCYIVKTGDNAGCERGEMFVADKSGKVRVMVWTEQYNPSVCVAGNSIILFAKPGFGRYEGCLIATKIIQAK